VRQQQAEVTDELLGLLLLQRAEEPGHRPGVPAAHLGDGRPGGVGERHDDAAAVTLVMLPHHQPSPGQLTGHQAGVRHGHPGPLGELGDAEGPADRHRDQHADVALAEATGPAQRLRDVRAPAPVGDHQLR
jgi:hypothetical protein